jgi:predicted methyltransferase
VDSRGFFGYLSDHPDEAKVFAQAMTDKARADITDLLTVVDFTPFRTIADIAGGQGHLLRAILDSAPKANGILFDLPDVINPLNPTSDRMHLQAGDFFTDPLPTADLYLLMEILHDWPDPEATAILAAIRRAAEPGATLLVIEHIAPDDSVDLVSQTLDVLMLTVTGGRERTPDRLSDLLRSSGFQPSQVIRTAGAISAIEAVAI